MFIVRATKHINASYAIIYKTRNKSSIKIIYWQTHQNILVAPKQVKALENACGRLNIC